MTRPAVFLDRDGVVNAMVYDPEHGLLDSPSTVDQVRLLEDAIPFVKAVKKAGFPVFLVTNQPGIAKGTLTHARLAAIHAHLLARFDRAGCPLDGVYVCTHHPKGTPAGDPAHIKECDCRKPRPGMLLHAAREHGIDLARSYMVGDGLTDVQAGRAAGCKTVLVSKLLPVLVEKVIELGEDSAPDILVSRLVDAALDIESGTIRHPWPKAV